MAADTHTPFLRLPKPLLDSLAGHQLRAIDYAVLCRLIYRYNGWNNGKIAASKRDLQVEVKAGGDQILKSLKFLADLGFIAKAKEFEKSPHRRRATEYRLTWLKNDLTGGPPTNEWSHLTQYANTKLMSKSPANIPPVPGSIASGVQIAHSSRQKIEANPRLYQGDGGIDLDSEMDIPF